MSDASGASRDHAHVAATRRADPGQIALLPWRFTRACCAILVLPSSLLFLAPTAPQNGIVWDLLMNAGLAGTAMMIVLPLVSPRLWLRFGGDPRALRTVLNLHADISYAAVALVLVHTIGLVLFDTILIEYLKLSAPWSMLAALTSLVLLLGLLLSSWYRIALGIRYRSWRLWHVSLSLAAVGLMAFHVVDAGYFMNSPLKLAIFLVLVAAPSLMSLADGALARRHTRAQATPAPGPQRTGVAMPTGRPAGIRLVSLLCLLLMVTTFVIAVPKPGSRAENEAARCTQGSCG